MPLFNGRLLPRNWRPQNNNNGTVYRQPRYQQPARLPAQPAPGVTPAAPVVPAAKTPLPPATPPAPVVPPAEAAAPTAPRTNTPAQTPQPEPPKQAEAPAPIAPKAEVLAVELPAAAEPTPAPAPVPEPEQENKSPIALQAEAVEKEANALQAKVDADVQKAAAHVQPYLGWRWQTPAAFSGYWNHYLRNVHCSLPSQSQVAEATGLPVSELGHRMIFAPADPKRPGVVITADENNKPAVDEVVTSLRNSTTATLLTRRLPRDMRANSILVSSEGERLREKMAEGNKDLRNVLYYAAAEACAVAITQTPTFRRRPSASDNLDEAASGGAGWDRFASGLNTGIGQVRSSAQHAETDAAKLTALRTKEYALKGAEKAYQAADEAGKSRVLVGYEVDLENKSKLGVQYRIKTDDGAVFTLDNIGKNFQDEKGLAVPRSTYASFNVEILRKYEGKRPYTSEGITTADVYRIAMDIHPDESANKRDLKLDLFPTKEGKIIYLDPQRHSAEAQETIREALKAKYRANNELTVKDVSDAVEAEDGKVARLKAEEEKRIADEAKQKAAEERQKAEEARKLAEHLKPVAVTTAVGGVIVAPVDRALSPGAHEVFAKAREAGLSVRVVGWQGAGDQFTFTFCFVQRERNGFEREVGNRVTLNRKYPTDQEYYAARNDKLAEALSKLLPESAN